MPPFSVSCIHIMHIRVTIHNFTCYTFDVILLSHTGCPPLYIYYNYVRKTDNTPCSMLYLRKTVYCQYLVFYVILTKDNGEFMT